MTKAEDIQYRTSIIPRLCGARFGFVCSRVSTVPKLPNQYTPAKARARFIVCLCTHEVLWVLQLMSPCCIDDLLMWGYINTYKLRVLLALRGFSEHLPGLGHQALRQAPPQPNFNS